MPAKEPTPDYVHPIWLNLIQGHNECSLNGFSLIFPSIRNPEFTLCLKKWSHLTIRNIPTQNSNNIISKYEIQKKKEKELNRTKKKPNNYLSFNEVLRLVNKIFNHQHQALHTMSP